MHAGRMGHVKARLEFEFETWGSHLDPALGGLGFRASVIAEEAGDAGTDGREAADEPPGDEGEPEWETRGEDVHDAADHEEGVFVVDVRKGLGRETLRDGSSTPRNVGANRARSGLQACRKRIIGA